MKYLIFLLSISAFAQTEQSELERRLNILAEEIQLLKSNRLQVSSGATYGNLGPAASKVHFIKSGISIGGYGEFIYNDLAGEDESGNDLVNRPTAEALRGVLYFGYKFENGWTVNTEIEIEHVDEIFLEFAYLDKAINPLYNFRAGLVLIPFGLVNQSHEPTLFYTVNRPDIETVIIPSTWRELGIGLYGEYGKFRYETYLVNGADATDLADGSDIFRGSRKRGGSGGEDAGSLAGVLRVDYQINPDSFIGSSLYIGEASGNGTTIDDVDHTLFDVHFNSRYKNWNFRGLFVLNHFNNAENFNLQTGRNLPAESRGFYLESAYDFKLKNNALLTPFVRYESYNLFEQVADGQVADPSLDIKNYTVGLNYKPIDRIVFKLDYTLQENGAETGVNRFSLGMGYYF